MCNFFSGVVTPRGVFWCETWSHAETRHRLDFPEEAVDVEYDSDRGLEVHEQIRLPAWFDVAVVALRVMKLYEQLESLARAYDEEDERICKDFADRLERLQNERDEAVSALVAVRDRKVIEFDKAHPEPRGQLSDELFEERRKIFEDYEKEYNEIDERSSYEYERIYKNRRERCEKLEEAFREQVAAIEGYVPPRKDEEVLIEE
jgi:hypothetical protein